mgnify:CR=1 FL=1
MADEPVLDRDRIIECLSQHRAEYLLVGGIGAQMHGALRPTGDLDSLPATSEENLDRLALAMRELNARLRVDGMTDEESRALPLPIDAASLARMDISTWRTDAGDLDVLTAIPTRDGGRASEVRGARRSLRASGGRRRRGDGRRPRRHHRVEGAGGQTEGSRSPRRASRAARSLTAATDGAQCSPGVLHGLLTNSKNTPIEALERALPLRVARGSSATSRC